jgi:hypothetical protein
MQIFGVETPRQNAISLKPNNVCLKCGLNETVATMLLNNLIFDDSRLTSKGFNWKSAYLAGEDYEAEESPVFTAAKLLLIDLQAIGDDPETRGGAFIGVEASLRQLASTRPYNIDVDYFVSVLKGSMAKIVPAMAKVLNDRNLDEWLNVFVKLTPDIPPRLRANMKLIGASDECLGGWLEPKIGAVSLSGWLGRFAGTHRAPGLRQVAAALNIAPLGQGKLAVR